MAMWQIPWAERPDHSWPNQINAGSPRGLQMGLDRNRE